MIIKEKYMLLTYGDNDFWGCAEFVAETLKFEKIRLEVQTKVSLKLYCKALFDLGVKRQSLTNMFFHRPSEDYMAVTDIVRNKEYYGNTHVEFVDEIPERCDNRESLLFDLKTKEWELL